MREVKLSGRERAVIKAIDEASGSTGQEIHERSNIAADELSDVLNGLVNSGYLEAYAPGESLPLVQEIREENALASRYELNPSYTFEIRAAMRRT